jgi:DNA-binding transcriptional ArsR family regulator
MSPTEQHASEQRQSPAEQSRREQGPEDRQAVGQRQVTDARTLRALSHPIRIALIEELVLGGPMTATEVGERIGESSTTCSFHLRQLAKYGFVEEAGGGKGRARPWRLTSIGFSVAAHEDPESQLAADVLLRLVRERQLGRYQQWLDIKASFPREWQRAASSDEYLFYLTPGELAELCAEIQETLMRRYTERLTDPGQRPAGSVPVEMLLFAYPIAHPAGAAT